MNDHNLDDLIIDTPNQKGGKAKGLLTIIALFIVVLIVAIILTKIILKDPDSQQAVLEENETTIINPELTLQDAVNEEDQDRKALSEMIKSGTEAAQEPQEEIEKVVEETVVVEEEKPSTPKPSNPTKQKSTTKALKGEPIPKIENKVIKIPTKPTQKPIHSAKPKPKPTSAKTVSVGMYYIQVGSFSKMPSVSRLTSTLKKQRYHYRVIKINNMHKVMVGPYRSRAEADRAIVRVKDRINKSAFVVKK